ncbi:gamma carbonic anhydrase family protein [Oryzomicrobium sp.]|uniref:gamma carbonic anhydrase family protein n=1 Tax=Oryzomicrobium sp. TaxID=1911578 RepID=UPI0025D11711|nr:gamma carbonic anhydrase family protein [Oryzomicrobium sp.]MCE1244069.1 gamma carbonic anhydrase family protein [Oryzomicrobium sp.]
MPIYTLPGKTPRLDPAAWVAPNATVIGDVRLAAGASVWWNAVLRGDNDPISIGANTNIQDGSVLHTDEGVPLTLGENVTVGHMVMLHGCTVGDNSLIGIGTVILNRAVIGRNSIVGANTLIPEGKTYPDGVLILGSPGKVVRQLEPEEIARLAQSAAHYVDNAKRYATGLTAAD